MQNQVQELSEKHRIWQPNVEAHNIALLPTSLPATTFTTTCLRASTDSHIERLNKEILSASQSYNSTAKPYSPRQSVNTGLFIRDTMSPKLVHQQYNSPLDLYSMNNIKKTIEAHSELLAPGVKGINFMKSNEPVNKQSEVYKLVKEEEEHQRQYKSSHQQQQHLPVFEHSPPTVSSSSSNRQQQQHFGVRFEATHHQLNDAVKVGQQQHQHHQHSDQPHQQPKCCECGQAIVGPFAKLQDRYIHPHCFNCSTCGTSLKNTGYFTINDKLYCDIHARHVATVMRSNYNFEPNKLSHQPPPSPVTITERERRDVSLQRSRSTSSLFNQAASQQQQQQQHSSTSAARLTNGFRQQQQLDSSSKTSSSCCRNINSASSLGGSMNNSATISTMFSNAPNACPAASSANCCSCKCHGSSNSADQQREIVWTWRPAGMEQQQQQVYSQRMTQQQAKHDSMTATTARATTAAAAASAASSSYNGGSSSKITAHQHHAIHQYLEQDNKSSTGRVPVCQQCCANIHGPYILAGRSTWCKPCSLTNFVCSTCNRLLLDCGFIETNSQQHLVGGGRSQYHCESCYENHLAPSCSKCLNRIKGDCLNALGKQWHPECFVCGHCRQSFGNSSFYLEDSVPYCQRDWNLLFTTKCSSCSLPIEAGDKWIEALGKNYHANCFRCSSCQLKLEGATFYCRGGKPYCRMHATR